MFAVNDGFVEGGVYEAMADCLHHASLVRGNPCAMSSRACECGPEEAIKDAAVLFALCLAAKSKTSVDPWSLTTRALQQEQAAAATTTTAGASETRASVALGSPMSPLHVNIQGGLCLATPGFWVPDVSMTRGFRPELVSFV